VIAFVEATSLYSSFGSNSVCAEQMVAHNNMRANGHR
jgi:hypothetical protein